MLSQRPQLGRRVTPGAPPGLCPLPPALPAAPGPLRSPGSGRHAPLPRAPQTRLCLLPIHGVSPAAGVSAPGLRVPKHHQDPARTRSRHREERRFGRRLEPPCNSCFHSVHTRCVTPERAQRAARTVPRRGHPAGETVASGSMAPAEPAAPPPRPDAGVPASAPNTKQAAQAQPLSNKTHPDPSARRAVLPPGGPLCGPSTA